VIRPLALLLTLLLTGCDGLSSIPWFFKTYEHPTYRFSLRAPRTWTVDQDSVMGSAVMLTAPDDDPLFKTNINVVLQPRREKLPLDGLADRSAKQLQLVFNQYRLLGQASGALGDLPAVELRGRYLAREGSRIVRTVLAVTADTIYVLTFTCREEREPEFKNIFDTVRGSFLVP
jgi:hypothetical protein